MRVVLFGLLWSVYACTGESWYVSVLTICGLAVNVLDGFKG
jgi:hypothetical protein